MRNKAIMDLIREYYIKHLHSQIPDINNVFRLSLEGNENPYRPILYFVFAFFDSLCFADAAIILDELWLNIKIVSLLTLPSDSRPYIIGLLIGAIVLFSHILFLRLTVLNYSKKLQENVVKEKAA